MTEVMTDSLYDLGRSMAIQGFMAIPAQRRQQLQEKIMARHECYWADPLPERVINPKPKSINTAKLKPANKQRLSDLMKRHDPETASFAYQVLTGGDEFIQQMRETFDVSSVEIHLPAAKVREWLREDRHES